MTQLHHHQQHNWQEDPNSSPVNQTLTLEIPDSQNPQKPDQPDSQEPRPQESPGKVKDVDEDTETANSPPPMTDHQIMPASVSRRGGYGAKRKKANPKLVAQLKRSERKLKVLQETLNLVPFKPPGKSVDFLSHESLLKRVGLWDFVHLPFGEPLRNDLVKQLIAGYTPANRYSYVNGVRIGVNRADLARALKLPGKKDRVSVSDGLEKVVESEESVKFIKDVVENWIFLHGEDAWMMPEEVVEWSKAITEGQFDKLEWASLIWFMVEKELTKSQLTDCYYASHLQYLIKSQKSELLVEPEVVEDADEEEDEEFYSHGEGVKKIDELDPLTKENMELDEQNEDQNIDLSLGNNNAAETDARPPKSMNFEAEIDTSQEHVNFEENTEEEKGKGLLDGNGNVGGHVLRRCTFNDSEVMNYNGQKKISLDDIMESDEEKKEIGAMDEEDRQEAKVHVPHDGYAEQELSPRNLINEMDEAPMAFTSGLQIHDISPAQFLASRPDFNSIPSGSSFFGNTNKREIDHENYMIDAGNKRFKAEDQWKDKPTDVVMCIEQLQYWAGKAKMSYEEKEQEKERASNESNMNQQMLLNELQRRDTMIQHLQKTKYEEQHRSNVEIYKLENELSMMTSVLEGYRKALKDTQKSFKEYREQYSIPEEPLYKDVKGSGGLVVSTSELVKLRLKQEQEDMNKRVLMEKTIKGFEVEWVSRFEELNDKVLSLSSKLLNIRTEMQQLKASDMLKQTARPKDELVVPKEEQVSPMKESVSPDDEMIITKEDHVAQKKESASLNVEMIVPKEEPVGQKKESSSLDVEMKDPKVVEMTSPKEEEAAKKESTSPKDEMAIPKEKDNVQEKESASPVDETTDPEEKDDVQKKESTSPDDEMADPEEDNVGQKKDSASPNDEVTDPEEINVDQNKELTSQDGIMAVPVEEDAAQKMELDPSTDNNTAPNGGPAAPEDGCTPLDNE